MLKEQWAQGSFQDLESKLHSVRASVYEDILKAEFRDWLTDEDTEVYDAKH